MHCRSTAFREEMAPTGDEWYEHFGAGDNASFDDDEDDEFNDDIYESGELESRPYRIR
jgi:hypothetical protein